MSHEDSTSQWADKALGVKVTFLFLQIFYQ